MTRSVEDIADRFWAELVEAVGPVHTMAEVRPACVLATRRLEAHLVEALRARSITIRVLPNVGTNKHPIRAVPLRAPFYYRLRFEGGQASSIVIDSNGRIKRVTVSSDGTVRWDEVADSELIAEDAANFVDRVKLLMQRNQGPDELGRLAAAMLAVLDEIRQRLDT